MVIRKALTIKQLRKGIAREREKLKKAQDIETKRIEMSKLNVELFKLKHRRVIAASGKGARLLRKAGRGIISIGKKAAPIISKQARLIREQQLRDDAIERKLAKGKISKTTRRITKFIPIKGKGKKQRFRKVVTKVKIPELKSQTQTTGFNPLGDLGF